MTECTVHSCRSLFRSIIFCVNLHCDLAVLMSCKILDRFRIHSRIDQIGNISMSMPMQGHLNTYTVNHFTIMRSLVSENRCYGMLDLLTIRIARVGSLLG